MVRKRLHYLASRHIFPYVRSDTDLVFLRRWVSVSLREIGAFTLSTQSEGAYDSFQFGSMLCWTRSLSITAFSKFQAFKTARQRAGCIDQVYSWRSLIQCIAMLMHFRWPSFLNWNPESILISSFDISGNVRMPQILHFGLFELSGGVMGDAYTLLCLRLTVDRGLKE